MKLIKTPISNLLLIHHSTFQDSRGSFSVIYEKHHLKELGITIDFVQDNQSISNRGVLRGLHFQLPPFAQAKLVRVVKGSVLDVAVDLRKESSTYKKYYSVVLSGNDDILFYIPEGFAHGFLTLENNTIFQYKCSNIYNKESEGGIIWNDRELNIDWKIDSTFSPILSDKDNLLNNNFKVFDIINPF